MSGVHCLIGLETAEEERVTDLLQRVPAGEQCLVGSLLKNKKMASLGTQGEKKKVNSYFLSLNIPQGTSLVFLPVVKGSPSKIPLTCSQKAKKITGRSVQIGRELPFVTGNQKQAMLCSGCQNTGGFLRSVTGSMKGCRCEVSRGGRAGASSGSWPALLHSPRGHGISV